MTTAAAPAARTGRPHWLLFLGLAATVVILDQISKAWIVANMTPGEAIEIVGTYVRLVFSQNSGGLFGMFSGNAVLFGAISILVIALIIAFHGRSAPSRATSIALGLLLGGAIGNLTDRFRHGFVVDFVDLGIGSWRWYTFNLADAAISAALVSLIVLAIWPQVGEWIDRIGEKPAPVGPGPEERPADG